MSSFEKFVDTWEDSKSGLIRDKEKLEELKKLVVSSKHFLVDYVFETERDFLLLSW